jgi:hypothetical protein
MSDQEAAKSDVKPEGTATEHINIKVTDSSTEIYFKIKKTTPLRKVMDAFSKRTGKDMASLRFLHEGERINADDTPEKVSAKLCDHSVRVMVLTNWVF